MSLPLTRRALLGTAAAGTALAATRLQAAGLDAASSLVIVQPGLPEAAMQTITQHHPHARTVELGNDVVRQWRDGLGNQLAAAGLARAYVPWAQAQILAGLTREAGGTSQVTNFLGQTFCVSISQPATAKGMG